MFDELDIPQDEVRSPKRELKSARHRDCEPARYLHFGWAIAGLTLAAPFLGGTTDLWAQAILAIATGSLFLVKPPSRSMGWIVDIGVILLVILAAAPFLPANLWPANDWRDRLHHIPGLALPSTRSPQPWITLEAFCLMLLGLSWGYYLLSHTWNRQNGMRTVRIFGIGIVALAGTSLLCFLMGKKIAFWPVTENSGIDFGFFPNRNQTANVLALGGIMINALAFEDLRSRRKSSALWFAGLGLICAALFFAYSRSGIALFFGGVLIWAIFSVRISPSIQNSALIISGAVLLLTGLFLFGGKSLQRFQNESFVAVKDFRLLLQQDAVELAMQAPVLGHGLGNFEPLFAMSRVSSVMGNRPVHPESDWTWSAVELGWLAPLIILMILGICLKNSLPLEQGTRPLLRLGGMVAAIGFALHGFVDVSGHRPGSLWPALFLTGIALHPEYRRLHRQWIRPAFRVLGLFLILTGVCWLGSYVYPLPTSAYRNRLAIRVDQQVVANSPNEVISTATLALRITPLDWDLYYQRARAYAVCYSISQAASDFAVSRILEPSWYDYCFEEGCLWLELGQQLRALDAWREALKRPVDDAPGLYRRMLDTAQNRYELRETLREWAREKPEYLLLFLKTSSTLEFELESDRLLSKDPHLSSLSRQQRSEFLQTWSQHRQLSDLVPLLSAHPEWRAESWPYIARFHAEQGDYRKAYETVREFAPLPKIPAMESRETVSRLEKKFYLESKDLVNGLALLEAQMREGKIEDAAATMNILKERPSAPRYLLALDSDVQAKRSEWQKAWNAWVAYEATTP